MPPKVVLFPHSNEEFETPDELRDWLASELKSSEGYYRLHTAPSLGRLEKGSIVFFVKDRYIVGMAVVEEDLRKIKKEENTELKKYEQIVKFFPDSIWPFALNNYVNIEEFAKVSGWDKLNPAFADRKVDDLDQLLALLNLVNH